MVANNKAKRIIPFGTDEGILLSLWLNLMSRRGYELEETGYVLGKFRRTEPGNIEYVMINENTADDYIANGWEYAGRFRGPFCILKNRKTGVRFTEDKKIDSDLISGKILWGSLGLYIVLNGLGTVYCGFCRHEIALIDIYHPVFCMLVGILISLLGAYIFLKEFVALRFIMNFRCNLRTSTELKIVKGSIKYRLVLPVFMLAVLYAVFIYMDINIAEYLKLSLIPITACAVLVLYAVVNPQSIAMLKNVPVLSICTCITSLWYMYIRIVYNNLFFTRNYILVIWIIAASMLYAAWNDNVKMRSM